MSNTAKKPFIVLEGESDVASETSEGDAAAEVPTTKHRDPGIAENTKPSIRPRTCFFCRRLGRPCTGLGNICDQCRKDHRKCFLPQVMARDPIHSSDDDMRKKSKAPIREIPVSTGQKRKRDGMVASTSKPVKSVQVASPAPPRLNGQVAMKRGDERKEVRGCRGVSEKAMRLVKKGKDIRREIRIITLAISEWEQEWGEVTDTVERWLDT